MVTAVLAELKRRDRRPSDPPARELPAEATGPALERFRGSLKLQWM